MSYFLEAWQQTRDKKASLLCVGIDPAEADQRNSGTLDPQQDKRAWCLEMIEKTAPFASAIKINRNYVKDLSRSDLLYLNDAIHEHGAVSIDDSKIADIGSTNHAALYHAKKEGFDAVTYAPFPGNIEETATYGRELEIGIIMLVLMSNPEFTLLKQSSVHGVPFCQYLAEQIKTHQIDGMVVGAPSPSNHIQAEDLQAIRKRAGATAMVLVPGVGAQGGHADLIMQTFGRQSLINATRSICLAPDPGHAAMQMRDEINLLLP